MFLNSNMKYKCTKCGHTNSILYKKQCFYTSCDNCMAYFRVDSESESVFFEAQFKDKTYNLFKLGVKAFYKKKGYTLTGILIGNELGKFSTWREYIFYNEKSDEYFFLTESDYEWTLVEPIDFDYKLKDRYKVEYGHKHFSRTVSYTTEYIGAKGEFSWDLLEDNLAKNIEFKRGKEFLVLENKAENVQWYFGTNLKEKDLLDMFSPDVLPLNTLRKRVDPYSDYSYFDIKRGPMLFKITALYVLYALVLMVIFQTINREEKVFEQTFDIAPNVEGKIQTFTSEPFKIRTGLFNSNAIEYELYAPVSNSWFETSVILVNEDNGNEYYFDHGVEQYHGYAGGEHWTEGSHTDDFLIEQIPEGTYRMIIRPFQENPPKPAYETISYMDGNFEDHLPASPINSFQVKVTNDVTLWSNFWWMMLLGLIYPAIFILANNDD